MAESSHSKGVVFVMPQGSRSRGFQKDLSALAQKYTLYCETWFSCVRSDSTDLSMLGFVYIVANATSLPRSVSKRIQFSVHIEQRQRRKFSFTFAFVQCGRTFRYVRDVFKVTPFCFVFAFAQCEHHLNPVKSICRFNTGESKSYRAVNR